MAATPTYPSAFELHALHGELRSSRGEICAGRDEAVTLLVRMARELVATVPQPLDRDALSLLRVAEACLTGAGERRLDPADVQAALAVIAKRARAPERTGDSSPETGTLAAIADIASRG
jgi:hypothetical protein